MILVNEITASEAAIDAGQVSPATVRALMRGLVQMLAPFAPFFPPSIGSFRPGCLRVSSAVFWVRLFGAFAAGAAATDLSGAPFRLRCSAAIRSMMLSAGAAGASPWSSSPCALASSMARRRVS